MITYLVSTFAVVEVFRVVFFLEMYRKSTLFENSCKSRFSKVVAVMLWLSLIK